MLTANRRILVIDDNEDIHEDIRKILAPREPDNNASALDELTADILGESKPVMSELQFQIDAVLHGEEGLRLVKQSLQNEAPYALVFVDVRMPPGWDGIETIKHLWEVDENLQTVIITAYADYDWSDIIDTLGITEHLLILKKPFESIEIRQMATSLCAKWNLARQVHNDTLALQQEINERSHAEKELEHVRHYLQSLIDSMPSALIGINADMHVTLLNNEAIKFCSREAELTADSPLTTAIPALVSLFDDIQNALQKGGIQRLNRAGFTFNDEFRFVEVIIYPLAPDLAFTAVMRLDDVTERVQMEQMIMQNEKMMSVGGLAAGMAHEINNPLGGILQGLQNIHRRLSPTLAKNREIANELDVNLENVNRYLEQRQILKFMHEMVSASERAAKIVDNMLQFSRHTESNFVNEDLNKLIEKTINLAGIDYDLKKKYDFRSISINRDFKSDLPAVSCIASEIQQVLLNLLRNAAQAMQQQLIREEPACITIRTRRYEGGVRIEIEDNGPGIEKTIQGHLFEPFFTTKPPGQGTGLGLSVSYFIIQNEHGGLMSVESQPGRGATFIIQLPVGIASTSKTGKG